MSFYDVGVDVDLVEKLLDPTEWTAYDNVYFVCLKVGEVMNSSGKLIGSLKGNKIGNIFSPSRKSGLQRSHVVLLAAGQDRPSLEHTADHVISSQTLNDSISNLRWATKSQQKLNQGPRAPPRAFSTPAGRLLPDHPVHGRDVMRLSADGLYSNSKGNWSPGSENKGSGDFTVHWSSSTGKSLVHTLMVECVLGRVLKAGENVDHKSGNHSNNALSNLSPVVEADNITKSVIKLVTRIDSFGEAVVFGGPQLAAEATHGSSVQGISNCVCGLQNNHNGYQWEDSSEEDIAMFFSEVDRVETHKQRWPSLRTNIRYKGLLKSIALFQEWEAALSRFHSSGESSVGTKRKAATSDALVLLSSPTKSTRTRSLWG